MSAPEDQLDTLSLAPLPSEVSDILARVGAPERLRAHLSLVHDVARQLMSRILKNWPQLAVDRDAVLFGAAIHDIGKAERRAELVGPGAAHEEAGYKTLLGLGVEDSKARFARTHALWSADQNLPLEDLLVSLADNAWKGKRIDALEKLVVQRVALATNRPAWDVFVWLDDVLAKIAESADARLAWQGQFSAEK